MQKKGKVGIKTHWLLCGMWAMFLLSCRPEVPFQYVLQVTVLDEHGLPADGVNLSLRNNRTGRNDYQYESQGAGRYEFLGLTEEGAYQLWVHSTDDYLDDCLDVVLDENKFVKAQFRLEKLKIYNF